MLRKIIACVFLFLLLLTTWVPAAAEEVTAVAPAAADGVNVGVPATTEEVKPELIDFICETYAVSKDILMVFESYEMTMSYLDINLTIHTWVADSLKGQVAWHQEEQRFIAEDELAQLFFQEQDLASQEFRQLQQQAGKMDVWLYQQVQAGKEDAVFEIYIYPVLDLTPSLEKQIRDLYAEYGLEAPPELDIGYVGYAGTVGSGQSEPPSPGVSEPGFPGEDCPPPPLPDEGTDSIEPIPADTVPVPGTTIGSGETGTIGGDDSVSSIDPRPVVPEEFYTALSVLYAQGFAQSLTSLKAYLDNFKIEYREEMNIIYATATAAQILDLRHLADVQWIASSAIAEDLATDSPVPGYDNTDGREPAFHSLESGGDVKALHAPGSNLNWVYAGGAFGLAALGLGIYFITRRKH